MEGLSRIPCSVQQQCSLGHMIATNIHFHRKAWSFGEVERGYHQKDMPPHDHGNEMDHTFLLYTDYRSAKSNGQRNIIFLHNHTYSLRQWMREKSASLW